MKSCLACGANIGRANTIDDLVSITHQVGKVDISIEIGLCVEGREMIDICVSCLRQLLMKVLLDCETTLGVKE